MTNSRERETLRVLLRERSYREGEFELSSGRTSDYYLDAKQVTFAPEGVDLVGEMFFRAIRDRNVDAIGGLTLGADPIVTAACAAAFRHGEHIPAFVIRKEAKAHGLQKWIEGPVPRRGGSVAIVDDVVTSGRSVLDAVEVAEREAECEVGIVVTLVDRLEGGREAIEERGYTFRSIFTIRDLQDSEEPVVANRG